MSTLQSALESAIAELAGLDWATLSGNDALLATVTVARLKAVADGALVQAAERLEGTGVGEALGWASTKDLLTHLLGGRKGAGGSYVRLAERTAGLPRVREALVAGEVSMAQAVAITTCTTRLPRVEELRTQAAEALLALATERDYDATDLDRCFPDVVRDLDPDGTLVGADLDLDKAERGAHHERFLSFAPDTLGGVRVKGYGTLEEAELIKAVLMPLSAPVTTQPGACGGDPDHRTDRDPVTGRRTHPGCPDAECRHDGRDLRDSGARLWDALVEACTRLQATDALPHDHGTTARIVVTMDYDRLRDRLGEGLLLSGDRLSAAAVRRLACDAEIIPGVLGAEGQVLDVGRAQRLVTTVIWLALVLRDRHCAFPGCPRLPAACDAHHIVHWADGGPTSLDNLILLCRKHHTLIHRTPWHVHIDPTTRRPRWHPPPPADDTHRFTHIPARPPPPLVA